MFRTIVIGYDGPERGGEAAAQPPRTALRLDLLDANEITR